MSGTASDNGPIKRVAVNGRDATPLVTIILPNGKLRLHARDVSSGEVVAQATDFAGNVEPVPHRRQLRDMTAPLAAAVAALTFAVRPIGQP